MYSPAGLVLQKATGSFTGGSFFLMLIPLQVSYPHAFYSFQMSLL